MPTPSLTPIPPAPGSRVDLPGTKPVTIGSAPRAKVRLEAADAAPKHARLECRDGGWWVHPVDGAVAVNGVQAVAPVRLADGDQLRFGREIAYEFATGERRTRRMASAADMIARPRKRNYGRIPGPSRNLPLAAIGTVALAFLLIAGAAAITWYGFFRATRGIHVLSDRQSTELDSLLSVAYDHVERGGTLLELGLGEGAGDEFAQAITTLELSDLRDNPLVKPRIEALEASVAAIYRERSLAVPENYANATSPLTPEQLKTASLTVDQFAAQYALMAAEFQAKFGHEIVVSGRDHAEHVALYGKGGAMDLSIKNMSPVEVEYLITRAHARHIRIKDFSQDTILRRQVANAIKAGLLFEAGTGLHVHIDRFANRHDRWTTLRTPLLVEPPAEFPERRTPAGMLAERGSDGL